MTNLQVIQAFRDGATRGKSGGRTTSKIQTKVKYELNVVLVLNGLDFGVRDLIPFTGKSELDFVN